MSFTQFSPTCGCMPLPALSLWQGRQPCRPRQVDGRGGGGPSSVAPRSHNPPTGRRRDSPISSSLFLHGPPPVRSRLRRARLKYCRDLSNYGLNKTPPNNFSTSDCKSRACHKKVTRFCRVLHTIFRFVCSRRARFYCGPLESAKERNS